MTNRLAAKLPAAIVIMTLAFSFPVGHCQSETQRLTAAQLTAIAKAESRVTARNVTVAGTGPAVTVLAEKNATASDRDLKVDAIFLAKALIEGSSGQIDRVKVLFSQTDKPERFILIDKKVVEDYGAGKLTPDQLFTSMTLTPLQAEKTPDVAEGPLLERRLLVWRRIEKLKDQGTGVQTFQQLFQKMEQGVKNSESPETLVQSLSFLEVKLTDQEGLVKQAKKTALGRGINQPSGKPGASASGPPAQQPPQSGGGGNTAYRPGPWGQGQGGQQGYMPFPPPLPPGGFPGQGQGQGGFPGGQGGFPGGGHPGGGPPQ
ncbi:MAG: hypothetical protein K2X93_03770 [Candidatus Obscuribacterales bacterium]|nr:hypothetical protein [Candidatus Obscuribacterales bacterium]